MTLPAAFDPIVNAPKPHKIAFGLIGLAVLGAAAYFLLLGPVMTRVGALRAQQDSLQRELVESRRIAADLARFRREAQELERRLDGLKERLPNEKETPGVYRALSEAAGESGLAVSLFQPRDPRVRDYYSEIPITVTAENGYHQLGQFFERIAGMPRVVNLVEMKLSRPTPKTKTSGSTATRTELTLATYMYRPVGSPPAPKSPTQPGAAK